tara:strand:+ start:314 stop:556 length:243 start_codon:yes stop_codon:yes gene_type:complete
MNIYTFKFDLTSWNSNFKSIVARKDVWLNVRRLFANILNHSWICQKMVKFKAKVVRTTGFITNRVVLYASQLLLTITKTN